MEGQMFELDFEPLQEKWNLYELRDGTRIRGRIILLKILAPRWLDRYIGSGVNLDLKTQNIFVVSAPAHLKGPPTKRPLTPDDIMSGELQSVEVVRSEENWNMYKIIHTGEVFKVKLLVTDVYRLVGIFDMDGQPVYRIMNTPAFAPGGDKGLPTP